MEIIEIADGMELLPLDMINEGQFVHTVWFDSAGFIDCDAGPAKVEVLDPLGCARTISWGKTETIVPTFPIKVVRGYFDDARAVGGNKEDSFFGLHQRAVQDRSW